MTGTGSLVRLALRRDRLVLPLWVLVTAMLPIVQTTGIAELYPTEQGLRRFAASFGANPAMEALLGPIQHWNAAAMGVWRAAFIPVVLALASLLTVIRHTRVEEETGRRELLGSAVVGRNAGLTAALTVTVAANLAVGLIIVATFAGRGYALAGALATGLGYAVVGTVFAAVGAVAAQLTESASGARAIAASVLGGTYLLRMAGDSTGAAWLSWLSPIAWAQQMRPFAGEVWWPALLAAVAAAALSGVAYALTGRRDVAAGVLPPGLGPAQAAPGFGSLWALAWRLHRGTLLGWSAGLAVFGAVVGGAAQDAAGAMAGNAQLREMMARLGGESNISDSFLATVVGVFGIAVSGYAVQAALRARGEETLGRAEPLLSGAVSRTRWMASHLVFALLGPVVVLAVLGLAIGAAYGAGSGDLAGQLPRVTGAALAQLPAVWSLAALAAALFGLLPRLAGLTWAALAMFLLLGQVGALLGLPAAALDLSPFSHLLKLPGGEVTATPLLVLTAIAAALLAIGLHGFRRRDTG
ncbi:exporter of polyketide antibiotics [Sphaerisporangium rufum]|uniref:Exporter of polyketide antibiotics n=1 Tax=Sphaerisporangium rufum TaxID=1381558 RepID=A0A919RAX3_9ACTN|nr:ABC transporter permease [Sphaerisporangium rufum]GII81631.1 exporter of polyketide antibiotics [Sphaerisporangium rufum]